MTMNESNSNAARAARISTLIRKELKNILLSPKFAVTFSLCAVLLLLSVYVGIREYQASARQYATSTQLVGEELREQSHWMALNNRTYREPDPMQIFVSGISNDIGRWSSISQQEPVKLRQSVYSDDPIFALFRFFDFGFIVKIVLSLFAFLFTYDAINGERESGTLAVTFANPLPRARYLIGKLIGSWLGLVIPLTVPVALSLLLLLLFAVPFGGSEWARLLLLLGVSAAYFTFFIAFGLLVSTLTRHSNIAFLICLVAWITFILVLPRAGVAVASQTVSVPTVAEVEAQEDAYAKDRWKEHGAEFEKRLRERQALTSSMSKEEREKSDNDHLWGWMEEDDAKRKEVQRSIDDYGIRLQEDLRNREREQEQLAFILSRFSPASAYELALLDIAGTNIDLKSRYEDAMRSYRTAFNSYTDRKQKESGDIGGVRVTMDSQTGLTITTPREKGSLDLTGMPRFVKPQSGSKFPLVDTGILILFTLLSFGASLFAFSRYDLRS
jgi:ABC-type transport system involved in multi-copper enzyme maturation permease subunit